MAFFFSASKNLAQKSSGRKEICFFPKSQKKPKKKLFSFSAPQGYIIERNDLGVRGVVFTPKSNETPLSLVSPCYR